MPDVKIFIACHKQVELPKYEYFYPVQAGAALAQEHFSDMLHDDTGNHISEKNDSYCELTVQYWAWKNQMADYYGFFHYRRFLSLEENQKSMYKVYYKADNAIVMENSGFKTDSAFSFIQNYDLLLPYGEKTAETVYQKYMHSKHHYKEDLDLIMALIAQHQPDYIMAMNQYLHGHIQYYYNMYIMKHEVFEQ